MPTDGAARKERQRGRLPMIVHSIRLRPANRLPEILTLQRNACDWGIQALGGSPRSGAVTSTPSPAWTDPQPLSRSARRLLWWEIIALFSVSLGASGVRALVSLIGSLTERKALSAQQVVMNGSQAPGRPCST
jgi:hypothetical protein